MECVEWGCPATPAFTNNVLVRQDDGGYVAGSNQMYAEPTLVYLEPTPVVESSAQRSLLFVIYNSGLALAFRRVSVDFR